MRFLFEGDHVALRNAVNRFGYRMEYMETDSNFLIVHVDGTHPTLAAQLAQTPGVTVLPHIAAPLSAKHLEKLSRFGAEKGDTFHAALGKIYARHPHHLADPDMPIS